MGEEDALLFEADDAVVLACAANAYARRQMHALYGWTGPVDEAPADLVVTAQEAWKWLQSRPRAGEWYEGIPVLDDRTAQIYWDLVILPLMRRIALPDSEPRPQGFLQVAGRFGERVLRGATKTWKFIKPAHRVQEVAASASLKRTSNGTEFECRVFFKTQPPGAGPASSAGPSS